MGRRVALGMLTLTSLVATIGAVQLAPGAKNLRPEKLPDKLNLTAGTPFRGVLLSPDPECRNKRRIRVIDVDTKIAVAFARTKKTNRDSIRWSRLRDYVGSAYAEAPRKDGCRYLRSKTVKFGPDRADLAIAKVAAGDDGFRTQYTITVTNLGPDPADGVLVTDDPDTSFYSVGSDPRCGPEDGAVFTCSIGTIPAGGQVSLLVKLYCPAGTTVNSASVGSSTVDPNTVNNLVGGVANNCV